MAIVRARWALTGTLPRLGTWSGNGDARPEAAIQPYEIMIILNAEADEERQQEMLERVQELIREGGGTVEHVNDWGRRKSTYPIDKQSDTRYVIITLSAPPDSLREVQRVLSISTDVVLRAMLIALNTRQAEWASAHGAPLPPDREPEGDPRGARGGRRRRR